MGVEAKCTRYMKGARGRETINVSTPVWHHPSTNSSMDEQTHSTTKSHLEQWKKVKIKESFNNWVDHSKANIQPFIVSSYQHVLHCMRKHPDLIKRWE